MAGGNLTNFFKRAMIMFSFKEEKTKLYALQRSQIAEDMRLQLQSILLTDTNSGRHTFEASKQAD